MLVTHSTMKHDSSISLKSVIFIIDFGYNFYVLELQTRQMEVKDLEAVEG